MARKPMKPKAAPSVPGGTKPKAAEKPHEAWAKKIKGGEKK